LHSRQGRLGEIIDRRERFIGDLNTNLIHEIERFFVSCNGTKGKVFKILGGMDPIAQAVW